MIRLSLTAATQAPVYIDGTFWSELAGRWLTRGEFWTDHQWASIVWTARQCRALHRHADISRAAGHRESAADLRSKLNDEAASLRALANRILDRGTTLSAREYQQVPAGPRPAPIPQEITQ